MKILLYDIGSYTQKDLIYYLKQAGCQCQNILYKINDLYEDEFFERKFTEQLLKDHYDFVMSTNFSPIVAKICYKQNIKYLAWIYDSPINADRLEFYQFPTSYLFLFDRIESERLTKMGCVNIFHLPLATNPQRLSSIQTSPEDTMQYSCDISFIGQFYNNQLTQIMSIQNDYYKGYINAILDTQIKIYGYNFIEEMITDDLIDTLNQQLQACGIKEKLCKRAVIFTIAEQVTHTERLALLNLFGQFCNVHYYSNKQPESLSHIAYQGTAYYFSEMPKIFRLSKLNLNPTLKSIQSGIPLRALDIMASKGTLLSNYQLELAEYFTDGEDVIMYESIEDALDKADFYLKHDDLRTQITQNGFAKINEQFTYPERISQMLKIAGIS